MKRILLLLPIGLLCCAMLAAQTGNFSQNGRATQQLISDGLNIAHASLPIGSKVLLTNTRNGKETEVTVISRISISTNRIADLSLEAWEELELDMYDEIAISTALSAQRLASPPPPPPEPTIIAQAQPKPVTVPQPDLDADLKIRLHAVEALSQAAPPPPPPPPPAIVEPEPVHENPAEIIMIVPVIQLQPPPVEVQRVPPPPMPVPTRVQVVPGYPNPNSNQRYHLQIGAFSAPEAAARLAHMVRNAGFDVVQELSGAHYRVIVPNVPAAMVFSATQRLGALGIEQIWVRSQ